MFSKTPLTLGEEFLDTIVTVAPCCFLVTDHNDWSKWFAISKYCIVYTFGSLLVPDYNDWSKWFALSSLHLFLFQLFGVWVRLGN